MKKVNLFVCFLLFCAVTTSPAAAAISDHVFYIWVDQGLSYEDPTDENDLTYNFCIEMDTDDTVSLVQFDTPAGYTFEIPDLVDNWDENTRTWTTHDYDDEDNVWWWEYFRDCSELSGLQVFGDGLYTIRVYYEGGGQDQADVWFGIPGTQDPIPQPTQEPVFISPPHHGSMNSPVTFTWQPCTDPAATGIWIELEEKGTYEGPENEFDRTETTWGPVPLIDGFWEAEICFEQWYGGLYSSGIEYAVGKYSESGYEFAVGRPWAAYEVWAGNTDYTSEPDSWRYYYNIDQQDYVKLGESSGPTATFSGDYNFYVIAVRQEVLIDSIRGSDGLYYQNGLSTGNTSDWQNILGAPDDQYATVGYHESDGTFRGFVVITNPGNWTGITVITDQAATSPIYRFWSPINERHFYTMVEAEKDKLINIYAHVWTYESIVYYAFAEDSEPGLVPVYRFWSPVLVAHFYTISESERDKLINIYPHVWTYEGIAFYAYPEGQQPRDAEEVYRFWSPVLETHFYTMNETEKNKLIDNYPHVWTYEGIAWYAYE